MVTAAMLVVAALTVLLARRPSRLDWLGRAFQSRRCTALAGIIALLGALGVQIATAPLAPASGGLTTFKQCDNGNPATNACPDGWINGALNRTNSAYSEDQVVPQRAQWSLAPNVPKTVTLEYEDRKGGIHAYDSLATWDVTQTGESSNPCDGITCPAPTDTTFWTKATAPIPADATNLGPAASGVSPTASAHMEPAAKRQFVLYGGTFASVSTSYVHSNAASASGDDLADITLTFTPTSTTSVLLFGGHIAASGGPRGWGAGLGAGSVSGGPYHISIPSDGSNDNQIMSGAILLPNLAITKTADAASVSAGQTIGYTVAVTNAGNGGDTNVSMSDVLPTNAGLNWSIAPNSPTTSGSPTPTPTCAIASGTLTCTAPTLAPGASFSVHVTSPTTDATCGTVSNSASVSGDDVTTKVTPSIDVTVNCASLTILKQPVDASGNPVANPVANAGDTIRFKITVSNTSSVAAAYNVSFTDALPTGLTWSVTAPTGIFCAQPNGTLTCTDQSPLAPSSSFSVLISSVTAPANCGPVDNSASATDVGVLTAGGGLTAGPSSASWTVNCPSVGILKQAAVSTISAGDTADFKITVSNNGPGAATNVKVTDTLPSLPTGLSWTVTPSTPNGPSCSVANGVLTCTLASMAANSSFTVELTSPTQASMCATTQSHMVAIPNSASVALANGTPSPSTSGDTITVDCPVLAVNKTADSGTVDAGQSIGFTITVGNSGPGTATNVALSDSLPTNSGLSWSIDSGPTPTPVTAPVPSSCGISSGTLTCAALTMASGTSYAVHVTSQTTGATCGTVTNADAKAMATNASTVDVRNTSITVQCPSLTVTKTADAASVSAGDTIGFTVTVANGGPATATKVVLSDQLPAATGVSWSIATGSPTTSGSPPPSPSCGVITGTLSCSAASLAPNTSFSVHVTSPTTAATCSTLTNRDATAGASNSASDAHLIGSVSITVNCAQIAIAKTADSEGPVTSGHQIGFHITVSNNGAGIAHGVVMTDTLPTQSGSAWTIQGSPTTAGGGTGAPTCAVSQGVLTCSDDPVPPDGSFSVHVVSPTTAGATCATVDNTASVVTSNDGSDSHTAHQAMLCPALGLAKTASPTTVHVGDVVTYTFTVTNPGNTPIANVAVSDPSPECASAPTLLSNNNDTDNLLDPRETWTFTCTHTVVSGDGTTIVNTAVATGTDRNDDQVTSPPASATVHVLQPAIAVAKTAVANAHVGDTITYTIVVTNPGNTGLSNVSVGDAICTAAPVLQSTGDQDGTALLDPAETWTYTCSHVVTAADGTSVVNVATVSGVDSLGQTVVSTGTWSTAVLHPAITIKKTANPISVTDSGPVTYTYLVTNTGDTTLNNVAVTDDVLGPIGTIGTLAPGASATLTKTVTVTTSTPPTNVGTATGTDVLGETVTATDKATISVVLALAIAQPAPPAVVPPVVVPPAVLPQQLPRTGAPLQKEGVLALGLLLLGSVMLLLVRRPRLEGSED